MTVAQKARDLKAKFHPYVKDALICVEEIIAVKLDMEQFIEKKSNFEFHTIDYWEDVKKELLSYA